MPKRGRKTNWKFPPALGQRRFGRIGLSHRNVRLFGTVWWLLYGRRRGVWELAQVKLHGGRMPKSPSAITWFRRRSVPKLACAGQSRIGGAGAPHWRLFGHYVVAWVIGRGPGFFSVASHDEKYYFQIIDLRICLPIITALQSGVKSLRAAPRLRRREASGNDLPMGEENA
jgi:hypothetical protein